MQKSSESGALTAELAQAAARFMEPLIAELSALGLGDDVGRIDHVCYRVADVAVYERFKTGLAKLGSLLSEALINGRPIASYKLRVPLSVGGHVIDVVELPAPKPGANYDEGFEHIEIVPHGGVATLLQKHPGLAFQTQHLQNKINPEVSLQLRGGLVKFHERSLEDVIVDEQAAIHRRGSRPLAIFDCDDTLIHSKVPFLKAMHQVLERRLGAPLAFQAVVDKARPTFPEFFANFGLNVNDAAVVASLIEEFQRQWPAFAAECRRPAGIESSLSCLVCEGVDVHVWTARDPVTTQAMLEHAGIDRFVTAVHGFAADRPSKPQPPSELLKLCRGVKAVVIGDSDADHRGAAALGVGFLQATWIHAAPLATDPAVRCAAPLAALPKIFAQLF